MPDSRLSGPISTSLTWKLDFTDCKTRFSFRLRKILMKELNVAGTKQEHSFKSHLQECVFSSAFYPRPH
jgi:hypothetical protein